MVRGEDSSANRGRRSGAALLALGALVLSACGSPTTSGSAAPGTLVEGQEVRVSAIDNSFRPETITVKAGTVVRWTNDGKTEHDVQAVDNGDFGVGKADFEPDDEYSYRFVEPGTYRYYCTIHATPDAGMIGSVVVEG